MFGCVLGNPNEIVSGFFNSLEKMTGYIRYNYYYFLNLNVIVIVLAIILVEILHFLIGLLCFLYGAVA